MPGNHDPHFCNGRIEIEGGNIVQYVQTVPFDLDNLCQRQALGPGSAIDVAAHRTHRCELPQRLQHFRRPDIASVDDQIRPRKSRDDLWPNETVGIGHHSDLDRAARHRRTTPRPATPVNREARATVRSRGVPLLGERCYLWRMPIKRDPSLVPLSHDHHHGLVRVFEIRQAIKGQAPLDQQRATNAVFLRDQLAPHFVAEEEHLFPVLREVLGNLVVEQLVDDHRELERLAEATDTAGLENFSNLLERHIRREEREIFRDYQDKVPAHRRDEIGAAIKESLGR